MPTLIEQFPLENRKPLKKTLGGISGFILVLIFLAISFVLKDSTNQEITGVKKMIFFVSLVLILYAILKYFYEVFYMKYYFYDSTKTELIIRKGVFSTNEITLPYSRIQDIYVDQDILDRIFGLYDVHVSSATMASAYLSHIDGVDKENSEELKKLLLKKVGRKDGK